MSGGFRCVQMDYVEPDLVWEAEQYRAAGLDFDAYQLRNAELPALMNAASEADVLVVDQTALTAQLLQACPRLKLVIRHGDGYDKLDIDAATELGIACANEPGFWSAEAAEQTVTLALALCARLDAQRSVASRPRGGAAGGWNLAEAMPMKRLRYRSVGIIGYGRIGSMAAELFRSFGARVMVYSRHLDGETARRRGVEPGDLHTILRDCDLISLHVPLTTETRGLIGAQEIAALKPGAIIVNTARGPVLDTAAATEALQAGHLGGLGLDTTDPEPLPASHPLQSHPAAIITPHLGWYSEDAMWAMRRQIVSDVIAASNGQLPKTLVNPQVLQSRALRVRTG